jgi:hypothetical protein
VISRGPILCGAALSALLTGAVLALASRLRCPGAILVGAHRRGRGCAPWTAPSSSSTHPSASFPISWQDTGSGVFAVAVACLALGIWPQRNDPGRQVALDSFLVGLAALVVDVYLY